MCKKLILLISVLALVSASFAAEDRSPPYWTGAEGWSYAIWEFEDAPVDNCFYADVYVGDQENHNHPDSLWGVEGPSVGRVLLGPHCALS